MEDPRDTFIEALDLKACRIQFRRPIVFICGGKIDVETFEYTSFRDAFWQEACSTHKDLFDLLRTAEAFKDWLHDGIYSNLIDFETDLASIASLVLIILESPGAIAELGAFSQNSSLLERLVVIVPEKHWLEQSFIQLGLLRYVRMDSESRLKVYDWNDKNPSSIPKGVVTQSIEDIKEHLDAIEHASSAFEAENPGHRIVIIKELIRLFAALRHAEIMDYLQRLGVAVEARVLNRYLYVLEKLGVIAKKRYSDKDFYLIAEPDEFHTLRIKAKPDHPRLDAVRCTLDCNEYYSSESKHRHRTLAIRAHYSGHGS